MIASSPLIAKDRRTKTKRQKEFLEKFVEHVSISAAADAANVGRSTVYDWLKTDFGFRIDYEQAITVVGILAENELVHRVFNGVAKHTVYRGQRVEQLTQYSDKLLLELLRARMPHRYGKNAKPNTALPKPRITDEEIRQINRALNEEKDNPEYLKSIQTPAFTPFKNMPENAPDLESL